MGNVYLASLYTNKTQHWGRGLVSEVYPDGTFELVPISNDWGKRHKDDRTYAEIPSWHHPQRSLADLLAFGPELARLDVHDDPDLHTNFAYGDVYGPKSSRLFGAKRGDWLLIIANMAYADEFGAADFDHPKTGWYFVGCLKIDTIDFAGAGKFHTDRVRWHQHWRDARIHRYDQFEEYTSVIVAGDRNRREQRFAKAVPVLSEQDVARLLRDKHGRQLTVRERNARGQRKFPTVMACVGSYTRAIRPVADTDDPRDKRYLATLREAILRHNPNAERIIW